MIIILIQTTFFHECTISGYMTMKYKICLLSCIIFFLSSPTLGQQNKDFLSTSASKKLTLVQAAMCERIKEYAPQNQAIVFSITIGKISCFTFFDPVPEKSFIYHKWYHKDKLDKKIKLFLKPPRWSTFSSIQFREADKGAWRMEVTDRKGNVLSVLRFSITD